ncbi:not available [Pontoporia blainvillei]|uniref:Not available n=1 Tax=Pontoporia blainvillei TaxID=48723 RepID=A0ABX0S8I0_PONBL|nr:not available [Pontoporia blainvillei]
MWGQRRPTLSSKVSGLPLQESSPLGRWAGPTGASAHVPLPWKVPPELWTSGEWQLSPPGPQGSPHTSHVPTKTPAGVAAPICLSCRCLGPAPAGGPGQQPRSPEAGPPWVRGKRQLEEDGEPSAVWKRKSRARELASPIGRTASRRPQSLKRFLEVTPIVPCAAVVINTREHLSADVVDNPPGSHTANSQPEAEATFLLGCPAGAGLGLEGAAAPGGRIGREQPSCSRGHSEHRQEALVPAQDQCAGRGEGQLQELPQDI